MPESDDVEEYRRLLRNQQDQGTTLARLQVELEGHLRDATKADSDFYAFVMHPEDGVVVRLAQVERETSALENRASLNAMEGAKVPGLERRVTAIEEDRKQVALRLAVKEAERARERKETKQWAFRDVLVPLLSGILGALASAALVALFLSQR